jgi:hypothetical protein
MRPDSIRNPTEATAITATVVAIGPSSVACSHTSAAAIALAEEGSAYTVEGYLTGAADVR